jgi:hypothetical protein
MNQLTVIDDVAARRTAAARKAWATRRAQGWTHSGAHNSVAIRAMPSKDLATEALAAFQAEAEKDNPDWHRAALVLKQALGAGQGMAVAPRSPRPERIKPLALPPSDWVDYEIGKVNAFAVRNPTIIVTFASGDVVRAPAVSLKGKALNIGRGLRCAIAFYSARDCWRRGLPNLPGTRLAVPEILSCVCEEDGKIFDPVQCNVRTIDARKAQDWRLRKMKL